MRHKMFSGNKIGIMAVADNMHHGVDGLLCHNECWMPTTVAGQSDQAKKRRWNFTEQVVSDYTLWRKWPSDVTSLTK